MKLNKDHKGKCGIYCIKNTLNSKVYVGKAKDIYNRIREHIRLLRNKSKDENRHLINAWFKYGEDAFEYFIIEEFEFNEETLKIRELYWIDEYKSTDREFGYNLRRDSSTQMIVHEETKLLLSEMYQGEGFGIYKFGFVEDIESITIESITEYYNWLIENAKIDIFVSGKVNESTVNDLLMKNENICKLNSRNGHYILNNQSTNNGQNVDNAREIFESMNVVQGKLVMGLDINYQDENLQAIALVYNAILGDGANSMMFQNVREKAGLAYSSKSTFVKQKMNIFIRCGIQIENYEKALNLIKLQLENIKNGDFTEEDIDIAKVYLTSSIKNIEEEQDTEIVYYIGQELAQTNRSIEEYIDRIEKVSKEDILNLAKNISINTIYFLKN